MSAENKKTSVLRPGHAVTILARTKEKTRVGQYSGYWLFVDFMDIAYSDEAHCDQYSIWLFSPFVE